MFAIFKRNFSAYFLNPTGYVFICVFALLCSAAAFLPDNFVNSNLANLEQLNLWFPLIAVVFTPTISMGAWAEEKRLGADELLTTQPVSTLQIVLGKYFASTAVFSASLLFSALTNFAILKFLGDPDLGLFTVTYLGYWLVGSATTAIAMVVSFLTSQLTVAYILGALSAAPLVALKWADALPISDKTAAALKSFSLDSFFDSFGRGVASLSGAFYFLAIQCVAIYACVVLLDRKTWTARNVKLRAARYLFRFLALIVVAVSISGILRDYDLRKDCTAEKLSALCPQTLELLNACAPEYPIVVEARLSANVPQEYVQTKINVVSILNELKARSKTPIFLDVREIAPNTQEAYRLERQYDVRPKKVVFNTRGQLREDAIFMTVVFRCGSKTLVIPFLNRGQSVEYELASALRNVSSPPKKRIGVLKTEAGALGRVDDFGREIQKPWPLIEELSKQYSVEAVDPSQPIPLDRYAALLVLQPSSLDPSQALNFFDAVRQGQPTLICEDPKPIFLEFLPGTTEKRKPTPTVPIPPLKCDLNLLWSMLGVKFNGANVLWKNYNPYPKLAGLSEEYLFVDARPVRDISSENDNGKKETKTFDAFNQKEPSVASLEHVLFPFVGCIAPVENATTTFIPLVQTNAGGFSAVQDVKPAGIRTEGLNRTEREDAYVLAARITGTVPSGFQTTNSSKTEQKSAPEFNVVIAADVDMATPGFYTLRDMGSDARSGIAFDFDNIAFVMNLVDQLADENSLIAIRSRRPKHRPLSRIEETTRKIRDRATIAQIGYMREFEDERRKEEAALQKTIQELSSRNADQKELQREESLEMLSAIVAMQQRLTAKLDEKKRRYDRRVEEEQREVDEFVRKTQGRYKTFAAALPPIPPLLVGALVYIRRKRRQGSAYGM